MSASVSAMLFPYEILLIWQAIKSYLKGSYDKQNLTLVVILPYFFGYKTEFFPFQNNPKDLDPSCKTDLDLLDCLGRVKLVL